MSSRDKLRSLFLATLMVTSVFAGTIVLTGPAVAEAANVSNGSVSPSAVAGGAGNSYDISLQLNDVSTDDGTTDATVRVQFPSEFDLSSTSLTNENVVSTGGDTNTTNVASNLDPNNNTIAITFDDNNGASSDDLTVNFTADQVNAPSTSDTYNLTAEVDADADGTFIGPTTFATVSVDADPSVLSARAINGTDNIVVSVDQGVEDVDAGDFTFSDGNVTGVAHTAGDDAIVLTVDSPVETTVDDITVAGNSFNDTDGNGVAGTTETIEDFAQLEASDAVDGTSDTPFQAVGTNFTATVDSTNFADGATVVAQHAAAGQGSVELTNTSGFLEQGPNSFDAVINDPDQAGDQSSVALSVNGQEVGTLDYETDDYLVEVSRDEVIIDTTTQLSGTIFRAPGDVADSQTFRYQLAFNDTNTTPGDRTGLYDANTSDGEFIVRETFNIVDDNYGADYPADDGLGPRYTVIVNATEDGAPTLDNNLGSDTVATRLDVGTTFDPQNPTYRESVNTVGSVLDGQGDAVAGYGLTFREPDGDTSQTATSQADGSFGFTAALNDAGEYQFGTNEGGFIEYTTVTATARSINTTLSVNETNTANFAHEYTIDVRDEAAGVNIDTAGAAPQGAIPVDGYVNVTGEFQGAPTGFDAGMLVRGPVDSDSDGSEDYFHVALDNGTTVFDAVPNSTGPIEINLENEDADSDGSPEPGLEVNESIRNDLATSPAFPDYEGSDSLAGAATGPVNLFDYEIQDPQNQTSTYVDILQDGSSAANGGPGVVEVLPLQDNNSDRIVNETRLGNDTFSNFDGLTTYRVQFDLVDENADAIPPSEIDNFTINGAGVDAQLADGTVDSNDTGVVSFGESSGAYTIEVRPTEVTSANEEFTVSITVDGETVERTTPTDGLQITQFDPAADAISAVDRLNVSATVQTANSEFVNNGRVRLSQTQADANGNIVDVSLGDLDARQSTVNINNGAYQFTNVSVGDRGIDTDGDGIGDSVSTLTFTAYQYADANGDQALQQNEVTRATAREIQLAIADDLEIEYLPADTSEYSGFDNGTFTLTRGVEYDQIAFNLSDANGPVDLTEGVGGTDVSLNALEGEGLVSLAGASSVSFNTTASQPSDGYYVIEDVSGIADSGDQFAFGTSDSSLDLDITTPTLAQTDASGEGEFQVADAQANTSIVAVAGTNVPGAEDVFDDLNHDAGDTLNTNVSGLEQGTIGIERTYRVNGTVTDALGTPLNGSEFSDVQVVISAVGGSANISAVDNAVSGGAGTQTAEVNNADGEFTFDFNPTDGGGDGTVGLAFDVSARDGGVTNGVSAIAGSPDARNPRVNIFSSNGAQLPENDDGDLILANDVSNQLRLEAFPADGADFVLPSDQVFHLSGSFAAATIEPSTQLNSSIDADLATEGFSSGQIAFFQVEPTASGQEVIQLRDGQTQAGAPLARDINNTPIEFDVLRSNLQLDINVTSELPASAGENVTVELSQRANDEPLANAGVTLIDPTGSAVSTATTDQGGIATFSLPASASGGTYELEARPAGFEPASQPFSVASAQPLALIDGSLNAPASAAQNETITVSAVVENTGGISTSETVEFRLDLNQDGVLASDEEVANQTVTVAGGTTETVTFDITVPGSLATGTYEHGVFTADDSATATINITAEGENPVVLPPNPAQDVDNDGLLEDINGDGELSQADVVALFNAVNDNDPAVVDNPNLFDFNGDGDVSVGDVVALFNEATA